MSAQDIPEAKSPQLFKCHFADCTRVFKRRDKLDIHLRVHTGERPFVCEIEGCGKSYTRSQHLSRHVENAHSLSDKNPAIFSCPVCRRELANVYCLQKHIKAEHVEKVGPKHYQCPEKGCNQSFHKKKQLVNHKLEEHTDHIVEARKCHRCPYDGCGKTFTWMNKLKHHMKTHEGYPCSTEGCDKVLPTWSSLRKHIAQDHAKVFSCDECGVKFSRKPNLTQHIKRKHQESKKTFVCIVEGCGRVYNYKSNLAMHMREVHEGENIWKNRPRHKPERPAKKSTKKISFAAKLCGLDDRGETLKTKKPRGKAAAKTDSKAPSEVDTQNVFEVQPEDPSDPIVEEAVNESKQNGLDPSDDSLFFENKQHNGYQPPYINHSRAQQFQEMEVDIGTINHEDISFKPKVSVEQCLAEITVIIR